MTALPEHLLAALLDLSDPVACSAVADWLEENGAPEAADVRLLASAAPVIPTAEPRWRAHLRRPEGLRHLGPPRAPGEDERASAWEVDPSREVAPDEEVVVGRESERYPMACGAWWSIDLEADGVRGRIHPGSAVHAWIESEMDRDDAHREFGHWPLGVRFAPLFRAGADSVVLQAFDLVRRQLIGLALREDVRRDESSGELCRDPLTTLSAEAEA